MDAKELNSWGLMYYNSLFSIPAVYLFMVATGDEVRRRPLVHDPGHRAHARSLRLSGGVSPVDARRCAGISVH